MSDPESKVDEATALIGKTMETPIMKKLLAGLPVWSFLLVLFLGTVRGILEPEFAVGPALLLYCLSLPYAIMKKACDGSVSDGGDWGAHIARIGCMVGIVATVLDQLRGAGDANGFLGIGNYVNCAAAGMLTVGTAKVVLTEIYKPGDDLVKVFEKALPFLGWMTTSVLMALNITLGSEGSRGAGQSYWLLVLFTAAEIGDGDDKEGDSLNAKLLKYSCLVGAAWSVCNTISISDKIADLGVAAVLAAMFMPLAYKTITETKLTADAILKNIVAFTFAALLGVHAILSLLAAIGITKFAAVGSGNFVGIFALCFVVKHKELIKVDKGEPTSFAKYAGMLGEYGPAVALVVLVLSFVKLVTSAAIIVKLINVGTNVSQLMMILGILLE